MLKINKSNPTESLVKIAECLKDRQDIVTVYKRLTKHEYIQEFVCMFMTNMSSIMEKYRLNMTELRIFFKLASYMEFGNKIKVKQKYLGEELDIKPANISKAIKRLKEIEILLEVNGELYFNPQLLAKGKVENYILEISNNTQLDTAVKSKDDKPRHLTQQEVDDLLRGLTE